MYHLIGHFLIKWLYCQHETCDEVICRSKLNILYTEYIWSKRCIGTWLLQFLVPFGTRDFISFTFISSILESHDCFGHASSRVVGQLNGGFSDQLRFLLPSKWRHHLKWEVYSHSSIERRTYVCFGLSWSCHLPRNLGLKETVKSRLGLGKDSNGLLCLCLFTDYILATSRQEQ